MYTHSEIPTAYAAKMQIPTAKASAHPSEEKSSSISAVKKGGISPAMVFLLLDLLSEKTI